MSGGAVCIACGYLGESDGPRHAYMSPSPACWARYGEVLAREYSDPAYWRAHRLMTDAFCGQHSVSADRRATQSLHIHLAALMMHFEDGVSEKTIVSFLREAARDRTFPVLEMPARNRTVGIGDIYAAKTASQHCHAVADYARDVFDAWSVHHPVFRALIEDVAP